VRVSVGNPPTTGGNGPGALFTALISNGLALPIASLTVLITLFLPLIGAMSAADAISGELATGTLRGLLIAPVSRAKLLGVKLCGVAATSLVATLAVSVVGMVTGLIVLGSGNLTTLSGTTLGLGTALWRVLLATLWVAFQVLAVAGIALAISTFTEHPIVVMATTLALIILSTVLGAIPSLQGITPYLITTGWTALPDFLRDPVPSTALLKGLGVGACYLVIGLSVAGGKLARREG
ncbi:MAG: ABC transporter permease, partial [Sciscionella sp.]